MSAPALLNLFNMLGKSDKMQGLRAFYHFFPTGLINSIIQEHECLFLFIIRLLNCFFTPLLCETVKILPNLCLWYGHHFKM